MLQIGRSLGVRCVLARLVYPLAQSFWEVRGGRGAAGPGGLAALLGGVGQRGTRCPTPVRRQALGSLVAYRLTGPAVILSCDNGTLYLEILAEDLVRFRLYPTGTDQFSCPFSYALDPAAAWPPVSCEVEEGGGAVTFRTRQLACRVDRSPFRLSFYDGQGNPVSEAADGLGFLGEGSFWTSRLAEGEAIYGLGEKALDLNLRGRRLEMWNRDPEVYSPGDDPIDLNIPMLVALREGRAYGFFFDNPGRARFDLGRARPDQLRYEADTGQLCGYLFGGPTIPLVLERYTQLTGRMPLPPRWLLGYHQSRWSYYPEQQVRELAAEFRRRRIPCDTIHLDIHHMDGYRIFTWDRDRFPNPQQLMADLRQEGLRVISIVDPGVKVDPGYSVFEEGKARGAFCKLPDGTDFQGPVWPGLCHLPDFTDPQVRSWWGDLYRPMLDAGVAGFWNDMNEPAIFGGEMPRTVVHQYEGQMATHGEIHNLYGLQMARASAEGLRRLRPDERTPLISRAGYAGLQRYALVWTADNQSTWAQLRLGVSMCLNLGLSGMALCGPDVGGFGGDSEGELLARWTQVGALTPFFRNHSALGTAQQEPWAFGEPYESICRAWIELRYRLLPYLYTTAWQAAQTGLPMMRPLALAFPQEVRTTVMDDQFLFGDLLLAAPVGWPGQRSRPVYLPGGPWVDFWTDELCSGQITADAPLERMPLYVRAGSVLPMGPVLQHSDEWPPEALSLHLYPGNGQSWLYEDDGHSLAYRAGELCLTRFEMESLAGRLQVRRVVDGSYDPGYERFEVILHGQARPPLQVWVDGRPVAVSMDVESRTARLTTGPWTVLEVR